MNSYRLRLTASNNPGCLENVLSTSRDGGFEVNRFSAAFNPTRNHYEIDLKVSGMHGQQALIMSLLQQSDIRSLTPYRQ